MPSLTKVLRAATGFASIDLREWQHPRVRNELRICCAFLDAMARKKGAQGAQIVRWFSEDEEPPYSSGVAADLEMVGLPDGAAGEICDRMNANFQRSDGLETFTRDGDRIRVRVPPLGFRQDACILGEWPTLGAGGLETVKIPHSGGVAVTAGRVRSDERLERSRRLRFR